MKVTLFPDGEEAPIQVRVTHITCLPDQILYETEEGVLYAIHRQGIAELTIDFIREHS
jgi:hypothetical protein